MEKNLEPYTWNEHNIVNQLCAQSCPTLYNTMDCSSPGSSVHGILQTRMPEWIAISYSRGSSQPGDWTHISCISCLDNRFIITAPPGESINTFFLILKLKKFQCMTKSTTIKKIIKNNNKIKFKKKEADEIILDSASQSRVTGGTDSGARQSGFKSWLCHFLGGDVGQVI